MLVETRRNRNVGTWWKFNEKILKYVENGSYHYIDRCDSSERDDLESPFTEGVCHMVQLLELLEQHGFVTDLYNQHNVRVDTQNQCHQFMIWPNITCACNLPYCSWVTVFLRILRMSRWRRYNMSALHYFIPWHSFQNYRIISWVAVKMFFELTLTFDRISLISVAWSLSGRWCQM